MAYQEIVKCTNCERVFSSDDELKLLEDENGWFKGCPDCKTDQYLMEVK